VAQFQWFDTGGYISRSVTWAKLQQIPAIIANRNLFTITTLQAVCDDELCDGAMMALQNAARSIMSYSDEAQ
jgi:hypothetical protein